MDDQHFSIQQLVLDTSFFSQKEAHALQNRLSKLYSDKLHSILHSFFKSHVPQDMIVKIDSLQLDLGNIEYENLEETIVERLLKALQESFPAYKTSANNIQFKKDKDGFSIESPQTGLIQLIEIYLLTGSLPWWSKSENSEALQESLRQLMVEMPAQVQVLLIRLGQDTKVRQRIIWQFNEQTIQAIIKVLEPAEADFIFEYHAGIVKHQSNEQLIKSDTKSFQKDVWLFIITFLIKEHGSEFNRKSFVKSTLVQIASHYNIDYKALLLLFKKATIVESATWEQAGFVRIIKDIFDEQNANPLDSIEKTINSAEPFKPTDKLLVLISFLSDGSLRLSSELGNFTALQESFRQLINEMPAQVQAQLIKSGQETEVRRRIAWQLNVQTIRSIIKVLKPAEADFIFEYHTDIVMQQSNQQLVKSDSKSFQKDIWLFIITFLMKEHGSGFNRKNFVKSVLEQTASHYNIDYKALLLSFDKAFALKIEASEEAGFVRIMKDIFNEQNVSAIDPTKETINSTEPTKQPDKFSVLIYFLSYGSLPISAGQLDITDLITIFFKLTKSDIEIIKILLSKLPANKIVHRLQTLNDKSVKSEIIKLLTPEKLNELHNTVLLPEWNILQLQQTITDSNKLEALRHYLLNGLFPSNHPNLNIENIGYFFIQLAEQKPYALKGLLMNFKPSLIIERLQTSSNKYLFPCFIKLLDHYYLAGILRYQKLIKADEKGNNTDYITLVQNIALEILLEQKHNDFKEFLQEWIKIIKSKTIGNKFTTLRQFHLLDESAFVAIENENIKVEFNGPKETTQEIIEEKNLLNLLQYFIVNGNYPWWGSLFFGASPSNILDELYTISIKKAIQIFQFAGEIKQQRERFLKQFSIDLILKIIQKLPNGQIAVEAYALILSMFELNMLPAEAVPISNERLLLKIIWEQYIVNNYNSFNETIFYVEAVKRFCIRHDTTPDEIFSNTDIFLQHYDKKNINNLFNIIRQLYLNRNIFKVISPLPKKSLELFISLLSSIKRNNDFNLNIIELLKNDNFQSFDFDKLFDIDKGFIGMPSSLHKTIASSFISMLATVPDFRNKFLEIPEKVFIENKLTGYMDEMNQPFIARFINASTTINIPLSVSTNNNYENRTTSSIQKWTLAFVSEYFFLNGNLPNAFNQIIGFSSDSFIKSVLLELYKVDADLFEILLDKYYYRTDLPQRLRAIFNLQSGADRDVLLMLNKMYFKRNNDVLLNKETKIITIANLNLLEEEKNPNDDFVAINFPLLKQHFFELPVDKILIGKKAIELLDYFLTWGTIKEPVGVNTKNPFLIETLTKEIILFLFQYDRSALSALLQKNTHLFIARIKILDLFKLQSGGNEALINKFLQNLIKNDVLGHFFSSESDDIPIEIPVETGLAFQGILPILLADNFDLDKNVLKEIYFVDKASDILAHYLMYDKLPEHLKFNTASDKNNFLKNIFLFLFTDNKERLKSLFDKHAQQVTSKLFLYDLFIENSLPSDNNIISFIDELLLKDIPALLHLKLGLNYNEDKSEFKQLLKKIIDRPASEIKRFFNTILTFSSGASYLAKLQIGKDLYPLLERANKSWANDVLFTIKDLSELFDKIFMDKPYIPQLRSLLQEFGLLIFACKIYANDTYLIITRFFEFMDVRMPMLNIEAYQHLQGFRVYSTDISIFNNPSVSLHFQKEISKRLFSNSALEHKEIENETVLKVQYTTPLITISKDDSNKSEKENSKIPQVKSTIPSDKNFENRSKSFANLIDRSSADKTQNNNMAQTDADKSFTEHDLKLPNEIFNKEPIVEKAGTKFYIQNAGLVLLHPFISTLFEFTDLIKERKFINDDSLFRAIHLLQYMIDGKAEHEEHLLTLNKIICGAHLHYSLPIEIDFNEKELNMADELFKVIFQRWDKMKNSTVDGFRQNFLQRSGMLIKMEDGWTLRVEQRGYDMLLQTIPWAYGMIKLPWMSEFLYVEWI